MAQRFVPACTLIKPPSGDSVRYDLDGDLTVDGVKYQIKFEDASFANEITVAKAMARA